MQLTPKIESEINNMVAHYAKVMGFEKVPTVEYLRRGTYLHDGITYRSTSATKKILGEAYRPFNSFFLNMSNFVELRGLHTIAESKVKKRLYTYLVKTKVGHAEETII